MTTDIMALSDEAVDRVAASDPALATYQGIAGHDHAWPDLSPAGAEAAHALGRLYVDDYHILENL